MKWHEVVKPSRVFPGKLWNLHPRNSSELSRKSPNQFTLAIQQQERGRKKVPSEISSNLHDVMIIYFTAFHVKS